MHFATYYVIIIIFAARQVSKEGCMGEVVAGGDHHKQDGKPLRMSPLLAEMFLESTYCTEPAGDSMTRKGLVDAILMGCVPVVFDEELTMMYAGLVTQAEFKAFGVYYDANDWMEIPDVRIQHGVSHLPTCPQAHLISGHVVFLIRGVVSETPRQLSDAVDSNAAVQLLSRPSRRTRATHKSGWNMTIGSTTTQKGRSFSSRPRNLYTYRK